MVNPLSPYQFVLLFPTCRLPRTCGRAFQQKGWSLLTPPDILHDQCQMLLFVDSDGDSATLQELVNAVHHPGDIICNQFTVLVIAPEVGPAASVLGMQGPAASVLGMQGPAALWVSLHYCTDGAAALTRAPLNLL